MITRIIIKNKIIESIVEISREDLRSDKAICNMANYGYDYHVVGVHDRKKHYLYVLLEEFDGYVFDNISNLPSKEVIIREVKIFIREQEIDKLSE